MLQRAGTLKGMKLLYKPFALILALIAGKLAGGLFNTIWSWIDADDAPDATEQNADVKKVLLAAALQGAVVKSTHAAIERGGARGFERFFGVWPGEKAEEAA